MSAATERELIVLHGPVDCRVGAGALGLALLGRAGGGRVEVMFSGASDSNLPAAMQDVRIVELPDPGPRKWRIESSGGALALRAHAVHVHRDVGAPFFSALPAVRVPRRVRLGWWALLTALRLPGVAPLIVKLRGRA